MPEVAHRILFIPELLVVIFSFLDRGTNVTNAQVCKRWSEIALDLVWKEVDNLLGLFDLLQPTYYEEADREYVRSLCLASLTLNSFRPQQRFTKLPEVTDWSRFEKYASRVRSLKCRPHKHELETGPEADLCPLLRDVALTRTSPVILPKMHTLEWRYTTPAHMAHCRLFLHRGLRHLSVTAPSQSDPQPDFYSDLCARAPHLHAFILFVNLHAAPIDTELSILPEKLPELKMIALPEFNYTSAVIKQLSLAKNIAVVDFTQGDPSLGYGSPANMSLFKPMLTEGAFPCLRELNLSAGIGDLDRFFRSTFAPIHITTLSVNSYADHSPAEVHAFLTTLQRCQLLSKLNLRLYNKFLPADLPVNRRLSYAAIKPVLAIRNLSSFQLVHKFPLKLTLDELEDLARKWPDLENLMLNAEPLFLEKDAFTLDLRALLPFARYCPRLRLLGIYIDASKAEIPSPSTPLEPFSALQNLELGTSLVRDTDTVATFLSEICPSRCAVGAGITWTTSGSGDSRLLPSDLILSLQIRCSAWLAIGELVPVLIQVRQQAKERSRALQEEVEDLRWQNFLLTHKAHTMINDPCIIT